MRKALTLLALIAGLIYTAPAAWAGEEAKGSGWSFDLPEGFVEIMSMDGGSGFKFTSAMKGLPVEGVPEMKAYSRGSGKSRTGLIMVTKVDLSREIKTAGELGLDEIERIREDLPRGVVVQEVTIDGRSAIELKFRDEDSYEERTVRLVAIAGGKYIVVIMMMTSDEALPNAAAVWTSLQSSIEVDPPINKALLFGLIAFGAIGAMYLLNRVGTRQVHDIPDHSGHWKRHQDGSVEEIGGLESAPPIQTGVRPRTLPSSKPKFDGTPRPPAGGAMPARTATSPEVTRPNTEAPPSRPGLRSTLPTSGRWNE